MKINCFCVGETAFSYINEGIAEYDRRLQHFAAWGWTILPNIKNAKNFSEAQLREKEGEMILKKLEDSDFLVLLDERGKQYSSPELAEQLNTWQQQTSRRLVFLIGGAYGFSDEIYARAQGKISLSRLTFSHQMVRLFFAEQLYRAFAILNNLPYHHA
jgi:23S rRNA (pseudouridine1915-N3)-methyltransferase